MVSSPSLASKIDLRDVVFVKNFPSFFPLRVWNWDPFPKYTCWHVFTPKGHHPHPFVSFGDVVKALARLSFKVWARFYLFLYYSSKKKKKGEKKSLFVYMDFKMCAGWKRVETFGKVLYPNKKATEKSNCMLDSQAKN